MEIIYFLVPAVVVAVFSVVTFFVDRRRLSQFDRQVDHSLVRLKRSVFDEGLSFQFARGTAAYFILLLARKRASVAGPHKAATFNRKIAAELEDADYEDKSSKAVIYRSLLLELKK